MRPRSTSRRNGLIPFASPRRAGLAVVASLSLLACGRGDDGNLWKADFPAGPVAASTAVDGYWEGDVAMGGIRVLVEPARITIALRCDREGRKVAQASAPIRVETAPASRMILQEDLAGGDDECGFRFMKGDAFAFRASGPALLELGFAGASVARLRKLADLPATR